MFRRQAALVLMLAAVIPCSAAQNRAPVIIRKLPVKVSEKVFDRHNPPKGAMKGASGLTTYFFLCDPRFTFDVTSESSSGGQTTSTIALKTADIAISLPIIVWLPEGGSEKLREHEQGHRLINEEIYKTADQEARRCAERLLKCPFTGTGSDATSARNNALKTAENAFVTQYTESTQYRSDKANAVYDAITNHGRNRRHVPAVVDYSVKSTARSASAPN
jgi:hypothetical protein